MGKKKNLSLILVSAKYREVGFFYDSLQKKFVRAEMLYQYFISVKGIKYIYFFFLTFL